MSKVILRVIGSICFGVALSSAIDANSIEAAFIGGSICLLFMTID